MGQLLLVSKSSWLAFNSYSPGANAYFLEKAGKLFSLVPGLLNTRGKYVCFHSAQSLGCVRLFATAWTVACHAPLSMEFSRPEGWSAISSRGFAIPCHFLPRGIILTQGPNPSLLHLLHWQADSTSAPSAKPHKYLQWSFNCPWKTTFHNFTFCEPCGGNLPNNICIFTFYRNHSNTLYIIDTVTCEVFKPGYLISPFYRQGNENSGKLCNLS